MDPRQEQLCRIGRALLRLTEAAQRHELWQEALPTAQDLADEVGLPVDKTKKRLKDLMKTGLAQPVSLSPKRYRLDQYRLERIDAAHPMYICFYEEALP